jgi:hypothetical protein
MGKRIKDGQFIDGEIQKAIQWERQKMARYIAMYFASRSFLCKKIIRHLGVQVPLAAVKV